MSGKPDKRTIGELLAFCLVWLPLAQVRLDFLGLPLYVTEVPIAIAAAVASSLFFRETSFLRVARKAPLWLWLGSALFLSGALFSVLHNPVTLTELGRLKSWVVFPLAAVWLWIFLDDSIRDRERALLGWLVSLVAVAVISLGYWSLGILTYDGRLAAWYASPNFLALLLGPGPLLAMHFLSRPYRSSLERALWGVGLALLGLALLGTRSYGAWASVFVASAVYGGIRWRLANRLARRKYAVIGLILTVLVAGVAFGEASRPKGQSLLHSDPRSSLASRETIWKVSARLIASDPVFGIGMGRFQEAYLASQRYYPPYLEWAVPQPHNLYLALWLQTGLFGLAGFLMVVGGLLRELCGVIRSGEGGERERATLVLSLLVLILVSGLVDTPYFHNDSALVFWSLIGIGAGIGATDKKTSAGAEAEHPVVPVVKSRSGTLSE